MRPDAVPAVSGRFLSAFPMIHLSIGLFGNTTFVVGSVLFLFDSLQRPATWLFIFGSLGMLLGSIGEVLVRYERRRLGEAAGWMDRS